MRKKNENVAPLFDLSREPNTVSFLERTKEELNQDWNIDSNFSNLIFFSSNYQFQPHKLWIIFNFNFPNNGIYDFGSVQIRAMLIKMLIVLIYNNYIRLLRKLLPKIFKAIQPCNEQDDCKWFLFKQHLIVAAFWLFKSLIKHPLNFLNGIIPYYTFIYSFLLRNHFSSFPSVENCRTIWK